MDKKLDYASILSINEDDDDENIEDEGRKDIIDTLIKDIDWQKNYNLRYKSDKLCKFSIIFAVSQSIGNSISVLILEIRCLIIILSKFFKFT